MSQGAATAKQRAAWAAERAVEALKDARRDLLARRRKQAEAEAYNRFAADIQAAEAVAAKAEAERLAEVEALAADKDRPIPLGARLREFSTGHFGDAPKHLTGRTGSLVLITRDLAAGPLARRSRGVDVGKAAVQVDKKDGKPGGIYVTGWDLDRWEPAP